MIQIKNTKEYYGLITIVLHWVVALGFFGAYASVYYRHWFSEGSFSMTQLNSNMNSLYLHLSFGITKDGTGLGLPFCQRIMRAFDGEIICKSEVDKGAEFEMKFPN